MRLKKIILTGFKSFVDRTVVALPSNLAAVVGPNGCGKSNIIDAVRWVMGESSAKQLRGESMADVIFNGSSTRKPLSVASIELIFDNSDHTIGGAYAAYTEISVKRQVSREGQSTYFLNNGRCRRRDITDIFLGTGLGPRSYAIIEQGMISRVIDAKPQELRHYIEEAAGISKYKERRKDTENRIHHTRENLARMTDLREELGKQLEKLDRQAKAAERFKRIQAEQAVLELQQCARKWEALQTHLKDKKEREQSLKMALEKITAELQHHDTTITTKRDQAVEIRDQFEKVQQSFYQIGGEITRIEENLAHHRTRREELEADQTQAGVAWQELQSSADEDHAKLRNLQNTLIELVPALEAAQSELADKLQVTSHAEEAMSTWRSEWELCNRAHHEAQQQTQVEQTRIQHFEQRMQGHKRRIESLTQEKSQLEVNALEEECVSLQASEQSLQDAVSTAEAASEQAIAALKDAREQIRSLQASCNDYQTRLQQNRGRLSSLEALQQAALGQQDGKRSAWLSERGLGDAARLGQKLQVASRWQKAVEVVLAGFIDGICIDEASMASHMDAVAHLQGGDLTLVSPVAFHGNVPAGSLLAQVTGDAFLPGQLAKVMCAENIEAALARRDSLQADESCITPEGVWLGKGWMRVPGDATAEQGVLAREEDISALQCAIGEDEQSLATLEGQLNDARAHIETREQAQREAQKTLSDAQQAFRDLAAKLGVKRERIEYLSNRIAQIETEIEKLEGEYAEADTALRDVRETWERNLETLAQRAEEEARLETQREGLQTRVHEAKSAAQDLQQRVHELQMQHNTSDAQVQGLQEGIARTEKQLETLSERQAHLRKLLQEVTEPIPELEASLAATLERHAGAEAEVQAVRSRLHTIEQEVQDAEQLRQEVDSQLTDTKDGLQQLALAMQEDNIRAAGFIETITERGETLEQIQVALTEEQTLAVIEEGLSSCERRIKNLGAINLAAIEEYEVQAERKTYLDAQHADLEESLNVLETAIRKIDKETKARFKETFDTVNAHFKELFPKVFGGGQAYLALTEDDLLESGVTLMAQPPGKRNSSIHLLSGGEKALTALSLVFGIFRLNPAPFCLLDEVDAPLDDANVGRFCNLVKEMAKTLQFVYISHNKVAMEMAEQLLGVTMHEPGVSRLVAVDVEEAMEMAEA